MFFTNKWRKMIERYNEKFKHNKIIEPADAIVELVQFLRLCDTKLNDILIADEKND